MSFPKRYATFLALAAVLLMGVAPGVTQGWGSDWGTPVGGGTVGDTGGYYYDYVVYSSGNVDVWGHSPGFDAGDYAGGSYHPPCYEQRTVSDGKGGTRVVNVQVPCDLCKNIDGVQEVIPPGYKEVSDGQCERYCTEQRQVSNGKGGTRTADVEVPCILPPPPSNPPSCDISANSPTIVRGSASTLSWTSQNATAANLSGVGSVAVNGSRSVTPAQPSGGVAHYTLSVSNAGGSSSCDTNVTVDQCGNLPGVQATVPSEYHYVSNGQCGLTSLCSDSYCPVNGGGGKPGVDPCNAGDSCVDITVYYLRDDGSKKGTSGFLGTGIIRALAPELSIKAQPSLVHSGDSTTVSWDAAHVDSCTVTGGGISASGKSGSKVASGITQQTIFTLSCLTYVGTLTATATVNLIPVFQEN